MAAQRCARWALCAKRDCPIHALRRAAGTHLALRVCQHFLAADGDALRAARARELERDAIRELFLNFTHLSCSAGPPGE